MWILCPFNILVFLYIGKKFFKSWKGFWTEFKQSVTPIWDVINSPDLPNSFYDRFFSGLKVSSFVLLCAILLFVEFFIVWFVLDKLKLL